MSDRWLFIGLFTLLIVSSTAAIIFLWPSTKDEYPRSSFWPSYVSISADGNYIAAVYSERGDVLLFGHDDNTPLLSSTVEGTYSHGNDITESVSISFDGSYIAVGGRGNLYLYSKDNKDNVTLVWSVNVGSADVVQVSADGSHISTFYEHDAFYLFSSDNNNPLWSLGTTWRASFAMASDGSCLILADGTEISLFNPENGTLLWTFDAGENLWSTVTSISSDGSYTAVGSGNGKLYLFDSEDNMPQWIYHSDKYLKPVISSDGNYIAAVYDAIPDRNEGDLYLFSRADNNPLWTASCPARPIAAISSNGDYIVVGGKRYVDLTASASWYGELYLFSSTLSTPLWTYQFPTNTWVSSVSMSADGQYIAVGTGGMPGPNIATSIYLFSRDSPEPLWVYYHEVEPYPYA